MATNSAAQFSSDIQNFIAKSTLPLAQRYLVAYQFGEPARLPKGRGVNYTATRFLRVPLPFAPLSEGVPPQGQVMSIQQVTATALQWGDKITLTDIAEMTIQHPVVEEAKKVLALQVAETLERNTYNALMAGTQINFVNSRGSRGALVAGDVLNVGELARAYGTLFTIGARQFDGMSDTNVKIDANSGGSKASANPRGAPHFTAICHPLIEQDLRQDARMFTAFSYSDINRLYNAEFGEANGIRFCKSNMVPAFIGGGASPAVTAGTSGALPTGTYYVKVTGSDNQTQFETLIYATSGSVAVTGPSGSLSVTVPNTVGYTWNVYVGTTSAPANLGLSVLGPTSGPLVGQATQIAGGSTVTITGTGLAQTPPATPASGVTVYPTFIFGVGAYAQVVLDDISITYLGQPDKSDVLNQQRVIGWKVMYGTLIKNQQFFMRIESTSNYSATFG